MEKHKCRLLILFSLFLLTSCKGFMSSQVFRGDIYFAIPKSYTYDKVNCILLNEENRIVLNTTYNYQEDIMSEQQYLYFDTAYSNSKLANRNDVDIYGSGFVEKPGFSDDEMFEGYRFIGEMTIYNNEVEINKYSFSIRLKKDDINFIDFTIKNVSGNGLDLNGFFHSESELYYSL